MVSMSQALRSLVRRPAFSLASIFTLAFGIAITAAAFAVVDAVLLKPLPYPAADRLVSVMEASPTARQRVSLVAPGRLVDWNRSTSAFEAISGSYTENVTDTSGAQPERLQARRVVPRYFDVYETRPILGRTFTADEEREDGPAAAIISEGLWTRRFGRARDTIGQRLRIAGAGVVIVGVMPRTFAAPTVDVWIPARLSAHLLQVRQARFLTGVGRMRPGVTVAQARADLDAIQATLGKIYPATDARWSTEVTSLKDARVGTARRPLALVFAAVGLLFLVAAANAAGLMLVQLRRRAGELAIRSAIGASRRQVIGAVLREVLLLALAGAVLGITGATALVRVAAAEFTSIPRITEAAVDLRVAAFVALLTGATAILFGVLPAWAATRAWSAALIGNTRITGGSHRLQRTLVAAQVALGILLAGGAGVLVRSYAALSHADPGFDARNVLTFHAAARWDEDRDRVAQFQKALLSDVQRLPQVRAAGFANFLPSTGATLRYQFLVDGLRGTNPDGSVNAGERTVTSGYLPALHVPLVAGQWCGDPQLIGGHPTKAEAMVNRRFVDAYTGGENLIGRHFTMGQADPTPRTIVGIVGDAAEDAPDAPASPYVYVCLPFGAWPDPEYVVRVAANPAALAPAIRAIVQRLDPARPVFALRPLEAVMAETLDQPRLNAASLSAFAGAALALVAVGLYALLTLSVTERRRELGVRLALGATATRLMQTVFVEAARLVAIGLTTGLVLLAVSGRFLQSIVFGVTPHDPIAVVSGVAVLLIVTLAAAAVPLRRAAKIDPIEALRDAKI
jgi:putative ABC transport system permease protein